MNSHERLTGNDYDLVDNAKRQDVEYVAEGNKVFMAFAGDLLYLFTVESNRKHTFAQQLVDLLNSIDKRAPTEKRLPW